MFIFVFLFLRTNQKLSYNVANISMYVNDRVQKYVVKIITLQFKRWFIYN